MIFFPLPKKTWAPRGAVDVPLVGKEEKRQFTLSFIINACGELCSTVQALLCVDFNFDFGSLNLNLNLILILVSMFDVTFYVLFYFCR
jgi:hypothetical protein